MIIRINSCQEPKTVRKVTQRQQAPLQTVFGLYRVNTGNLNVTQTHNLRLVIVGSIESRLARSIGIDFYVPLQP